MNKNELVSQLVSTTVDATQKLHYIQFGVNMDSLTPPNGYCDADYANALSGVDITGAFSQWMYIGYNSNSALNIKFNKHCVNGLIGLTNGCDNGITGTAEPINMQGKLRLTMSYFQNRLSGAETQYSYFVKVNDYEIDTGAFDGSYDTSVRSDCLAYIDISFNRYKVKFLGSQAKQLPYNGYAV